jgi:hypothetical protein
VPGRCVARVPAAGDAERGHLAGGQQHAQRGGELGGVGSAWYREAQAGQRGGVDHVQVHVHVERARGQVGGGQAGYLAAADGRAGQVGHLGRVEVARAGQHDSFLGHRAQAQPGGDQLGPVPDQQAQRQATQVTGRGGFKRLHVAVPVEPDDGRIGAGALESGHDPGRGVAVPRHHDRTGAGRHFPGHRAGHRRLQHSHALPGVTGGKPGGDHLVRLEREVQVGQVFVQVVRDANDCHRYNLGSTGSDSRARTAKTHSCTRHNGSPPAARSRASRPRAYSRSASERLCDRARWRSRVRLAGSV